LDQLIAGMGEDGLLAMVCTRISEGESLRHIALGNGMPQLVLRRWMEDDPKRMKEWELADRCFADSLAYEGLSAAKEATVEDVAVARLRVDAYNKAAGKLARAKWGERQEITVTHEISVLGALEEARGRVQGVLPVVVTYTEFTEEVVI